MLIILVHVVPEGDLDLSPLIGSLSSVGPIRADITIHRTAAPKSSTDSGRVPFDINYLEALALLNRLDGIVGADSLCFSVTAHGLTYTVPEVDPDSTRQFRSEIPNVVARIVAEVFEGYSDLVATHALTPVLVNA